MRRFLKMTGLVLVSIGLFYVLNRLSTDLLKWQVSLPFIQQLFSFFALGSVIWLTGRAVNYVLLHWSYRQQLSASFTLVLLTGCWLVSGGMIALSLKSSLTDASWPGIVTALILAAEVTVYPLVAAFYQRKEVLANLGSSCALNNTLVNIQASH